MDGALHADASAGGRAATWPITLDRDFPFVGRTDELRNVIDLLNCGSSAGVVVAGTWGAGKSRFVDEVATAVMGTGFVVQRAYGTRDKECEPLGALAGVLSTVGLFPPADSQDAAYVLQQCVREYGWSQREGNPLIIVDDAHLLDNVSAELIYGLASSGKASVLAVVRSCESAPDSILRLWKDGLAPRVEIDAFRAGAVRELVETIVRGEVDRHSIAELLDSSKGNLIFLQAFIVEALRNGILRPEDGVWRLTENLRPNKRILKFAQERLEEFSADERRLIGLLAVAEYLTPDEISGLTRVSTVDDLERKQVLRVDQSSTDPVLRLSHSFFGIAVRASLGDRETRAIAQTLAEAVEKAGARSDDDVLRLGTWRLTCGGATADLFLSAARTAHGRLDLTLAESLAQAATSAGAGYEAKLLVAQLQGLQGRYHDAESALSELWSSATDDDQRFRVATTQVSHLFWADRSAESLRLATNAELQIENPVLRQQLSAQRALILAESLGPYGLPTQAAPLADIPGGQALVWESFAATLSLSHLGQLDAALSFNARGYEAHIALDTKLEWDPWYHLVIRAMALEFSGRLNEAESIASEQLHQARITGNNEAAAFFSCQLAATLIAKGKIAAALGAARESMYLARHLGRRVWSQHCLSTLALALSLAGYPAEAAQKLAEIDLGGPAPMYNAVGVLEARAWAALAAGDRVAAREYLERGALLGEETGDLVGGTACLHGLARLGWARDVVERIGSLGACVEGALASARVAHTSALAAGAPADLQRASASFASIGADLLAAEASCSAAELWQQVGERRSAEAALKMAQCLASRCEGAVTPGLRLLANAIRLTESDLDAARLAAAGLSNRRIAAKLCLSVRTIENRLLQVYRKLGVSRRQDLGAALEWNEARIRHSAGDDGVATVPQELV